jgi:4-amino-4-deoxy-L-arabinose transferase-like glycosyltransferase
MLLASFSTRARVLGLIVLVLLAVLAARLWTALVWPIPLSVDEAQYLVWSRDLQTGYYSKPPLVAWALSLATLGCAAPANTNFFAAEGCVRWLQPLAMAGAGLFVFATAQALFHRRHIGIWAVVLFFLAPLTAFYSQAATTDAWLLLWWSAALWAFVKALGPSRELGRNLRLGSELLGQSSQTQLAWWMACGVFAGLGLLTKYSMGVFAVSALIVLIQRRLLLTPGPWLCALMALLVFSPNLAWNAQLGWPTFAHHADITVGQDHGLRLAGLWNFFAAQWLTFSPIVFGMFLWGSLRRLGRIVGGRSPYEPEVSKAISLLIAFAWPMLLVVMAQSALSRAHANWASPALVAMSLVVAAWWLANSASRGSRLPLSTSLGLWFTLTLNLALTGLLLGSPWWVQELGLKGHRASDPFVRLTGYKETAQVVGRVLSQNKGAPNGWMIASDDRKLLANLSAYIPKAQVFAFNPQGLKDNHWQLQHDLKQLMTEEGGNREPKKILLVQVISAQGPSTDLMEPLSRGFTQVEPLGRSNPSLSAALSTIRLEGKPNQGVTAYWVWLQPSKTPIERGAVRAPETTAPAQ